MTKIVTKQELIPADKAKEIIKLTQLQKEVKSRLDSLKAELLAYTQENDVLTLKTGAYTISRAKRDTITVMDHESAYKFLQDKNIPADMVRVLSDATENVVKTLVKSGTNVAGVAHQQTEYISIRVAKES